MTHIETLNKRLAHELGFTPYDSGPESGGVYQWSWSDDLYWPARPTGRRVEAKTDSGLYVMQNEHVRMPLTNKRGVWIITKWCAPETLTDWQRMFPGAAYPARGFRIHTNQYLRPGLVPTLEETEQIIWAVRQQGAKTRGEVESEMTQADDKAERAAQSKREDEVEELIPAFLNHEPGKRGNRVSLPITRQDKLSDGSLIN